MTAAREAMTDAGEIMAQAQADYWENPSIPEGYLPMVDHVLAVLTSAGFRILGPDEIDGPTVERCAEVADTKAAKVRDKGNLTAMVVSAILSEIATALRALKEKRT